MDRSGAFRHYCICWTIPHVASWDEKFDLRCQASTIKCLNILQLYRYSSKGPGPASQKHHAMKILRSAQQQSHKSSASCETPANASPEAKPTSRIASYSLIGIHQPALSIRLTRSGRYFNRLVLQAITSNRCSRIGSKYRCTNSLPPIPGSVT